MFLQVELATVANGTRSPIRNRVSYNKSMALLVLTQHHAKKQTGGKPHPQVVGLFQAVVSKEA